MRRGKVIPFRGRPPRFCPDPEKQLVPYRGRRTPRVPQVAEHGEGGGGETPLRAASAPAPAEADAIWCGADGLYSTLLRWACDENPNDLEDAFRRLCALARQYVGQRRFRAWASDFRRRDESATLRVLARMDVDAFIEHYRVYDEDWGLAYA